MKEQMFSEAMGKLSDKYITEAINYSAKKKQKNMFFIVSKYVAVACMFVAVGFGTLLAVNTEVRAAVWGWVSELHADNMYKIFFDGEAEETEGLKYELGWLPEGTEFVTNMMSKVENHIFIQMKQNCLSTLFIRQTQILFII